MKVETGLVSDAPARWQYRVVSLGMLNTPERLTQSLGALGSEGWELVHVYDKSSNWWANMEKGFAIFKRSVDPEAEPEGPWATWQHATEFAVGSVPGKARGYDEEYAQNPY